MKFVTASLVLVAFAALWIQTGYSAGTPVVVKATILPDLKITFTPKSVRHGTVIFKVKNTSFGAHQFSINGVTTKPIPPRMVVSAKVTFKLPAIYSATLADCGYLSRCAGSDEPSGNVKVT